MKFPRLIGTIQLPPLPGSPGSHHESAPHSLQAAGFLAVQEAEALAQAGFEAVILQNRGDLPYFDGQVPPETIASMSIIAAAVREAISLPIGIRVLKNDPSAALAIAAVTGCDFIVYSFSFDEHRNSTHLNGEKTAPAFLVRERDRLHVPVALLAETEFTEGDLNRLDLHPTFHERVSTAGIDAVILKWNGEISVPSWDALKATAQMIRKQQVPLYLRGQIGDDLIPEVKSWADGIIALSEFRKGGSVEGAVDAKRAREWVRRVRKPEKPKKAVKLKSTRKALKPQATGRS